MYDIHLKGDKKAVLLALANVVGVTEPEIIFEESVNDKYVVHCKVETKWDANPFGDNAETWDGKKVDLSNYDEKSLVNGDYFLSFEGYGALRLSGMLNIDIEILNTPDDTFNPFCEFVAYSNGEMLEESRFQNLECDGDIPDDMSSEELEEMFDEWHDFRF